MIRGWDDGLTTTSTNIKAVIWSVYPDETPPAEVRSLAQQVLDDGGACLSIYREPVGGRWQLFCLLPREKVSPTPYQRDLSPSHVKRLLEVVRKLDRFIDPVVAVSPKPGVYWTPNGNHRRAVLEKLKTMYIPAILIPEMETAYQILALNTEKAHNLREKSLEVVRMYEALAETEPKTHEEKYAFQLESPHLITLGILYRRRPRFAGGAFAPILRRVDRFLKLTLDEAWEERNKRAELVERCDDILNQLVAKLKRRGIRHPYVRNYILARTTPLTRARKTLPAFETALRKLAENLEKFDISKVSYEDIMRQALVATAE
ncbi:MAG: chromosome partitioning protein ParB [Nitrososphaerota archaeon]